MPFQRVETTIWETDKSKWGNEGQVPSGGNQLSLLFVIEDTHTT